MASAKSSTRLVLADMIKIETGQSSKVLLIFHPLVGGEQNVEPCFGRESQQLAVLHARPALALNGD